MCLGYLFNLLDRRNKQQHKVKEAVFPFGTIHCVRSGALVVNLNGRPATEEFPGLSWYAKFHRVMHTAATPEPCNLHLYDSF